MPTANKTKKAPAKRATTSRGASVGGVKAKSKKKFILFSLVAVLVLAGIGYGGNYAWQRYQTKHQLSSVSNDLKAHAESPLAALTRIGYTYGVIIHNDSNYVQWACKKDNRYVSVLTARKSSRTYYVHATATAGRYWRDSSGASTSWWANLNLQQIDMWRDGHNYIGYASSALDAPVYTKGSPIGTPMGPGSWYKGRTVSYAGQRYIRTSDLPICHY